MYEQVERVCASSDDSAALKESVNFCVRGKVKMSLLREEPE